MAHETYRLDGAGRSYLRDEADASGPPQLTIVHVAAGAIALAILIGLAIWGYKLMVRDVAGIPVVRAMSGEARSKPSDPGGVIATNQGLAVNSIAADGTTAEPADRLVLAPQPVTLTAEDTPTTLAPIPQLPSYSNEIDQARVAAATASGSMEDLIAALTENVEPIDPNPVQTAALVSQETASVADFVVPTQGAAIQVSLRPRQRPIVLPTAQTVRAPLATPQPAVPPIANVSPSTNSAPSDEMDPSLIPAGTRLVQLGAYESAEIARGQWEVFTARFGTLMAGKTRVIQRAEPSGRVFYRLRVLGFNTLDETRSFCSTLEQRGADCIPVVTR